MSIVTSIQGNLSEYILFLWQSEDLIRAFDFNLEDVKNHYLAPSAKDEVGLSKDFYWFQTLANEMLAEGVKEKGHTQRSLEKMAELEAIHLLLFAEVEDPKYLKIIEKAYPLVGEFIKKKSGKKSQTLTTACLNALYGFLLLRLKQEKISEETQEAVKTFKEILAYLSAKYKQMQAN